MRSANLSSAASIPLTTSRPKPAAEQPSPLPPPRSSLAPSNCRLRASVGASVVKPFCFAREHMQLAVEPCGFEGEAGSFGGRRNRPCDRAGRACGRGFPVRPQAFIACGRCSRPCGDVRPGRRPGSWACGCSARTWLRGGFRGRHPCRRPWPARNRRGRRS